jgi:hypothetical protein
MVNGFYAALREPLLAKLNRDSTNKRLVLDDWHFEFKRAPNSKSQYIDIFCENFK